MSSRKLVATIASLALVVAFSPQAAGAEAMGAEVIKDGSFESTPAGQDNPNWDEGGIAPPICDESCGDGAGTAGPRTGNNWAYFGGVPTADFQSVSQEVLIPSAPATLTFWLWLGRSNGGALDAFRVFIDDTELFELLENGTGYGTYTEVSLDMSPYVGGAVKTLSFQFDGFGGVPTTNISLDDVSLMAGEAPAVAAKSVTLSAPKAAKEGKRAKLTAKVEPCAGHEGHAVELFRGGKKIRTASSDGACTAVFRVKIKKTARYRAVSPQQDTDHGSATSNKVKVRAR